MRKKILFFVLIFICMLTNVLALENDNYIIEIPNNYIKDTSNEAKELWSVKNKNDSTSILVYVEENKNQLNVSKYDSEYIKSRIDEFKSNLEKEFEKNKQEATIKSIDGEIKKVNNYDCIILNTDINYVFSEKDNADVYQTRYTFTSKNYIYNLVITSSNKDELTSETINNTIKSFSIKDKLFDKELTPIERLVELVKKYIVAIILVIILLITFIVGLIISKLKRNKKKKNKKEIIEELE